VTGDKYEAFNGVTGALLASSNETRWGGTVGAGLDFGFAQNWSVGVEYDHRFMGSRNITLTAPLFSETEHISQDVDIGSGSPELPLWRLWRSRHGPLLISGLYSQLKPRHCPGLFCRSQLVARGRRTRRPKAANHS